MSQYHFEFRTIHAHLSKWDSWQPTPALCTCHSLSHWWHFSPVSWAFLSDSCLRTTFVSSLSFLFVFSSSASLFWKHFLRHHLFLSLLFMLAAWIPSPPTFLTRLKISVCVCVCVCVCARTCVPSLCSYSNPKQELGFAWSASSLSEVSLSQDCAWILRNR